MDINPVVLSIPLYFSLIIIELIFQFFTKKELYRTNDAITNISCGITSQIIGGFTKVLGIGVYQYAYEHLAIGHIPNTWWSAVLLFLGIDFCYYWAHRASHEVNFLWNGGHVVHHQSEDYNFSVALRQSSLDIWTLWFYVPLAVIGFDTYSFLYLKAINLVYQFWIHTETVGKLPRPIEWVFNTPSHHRVHHGRNPKYIDRNHAGVFMFWDRLFGTFQPEEDRPIYGITSPMNSWNPVWANFQPYFGMFRQVWMTPGFMNKLKVLFYKPGWRPKELGGYLRPPNIKRAEITKFDAHPSSSLAYYVIFQFLTILGLTTLFLFTSGNMDLTFKLGLSALIIWSVGQLGMLLENRTSWINAEFVRILVMIGSLYALFYNPIVLTGLLSYGLASIFWLILIRKTSIHSEKSTSQ